MTNRCLDENSVWIVSYLYNIISLLFRMAIFQVIVFILLVLLGLHT